MNHSDYVELKRKELVSIAKAMLSEEVELIYGAREIDQLRHEIDEGDNPIFQPILLFMYDTDHMPVSDEVRARFAPELLNRLDAELNEYAVIDKNSIFECCKKIIETFSC